MAQGSSVASCRCLIWSAGLLVLLGCESEPAGRQERPAGAVREVSAEQVEAWIEALAMSDAEATGNGAAIGEAVRGLAGCGDECVDAMIAAIERDAMNSLLRRRVVEVLGRIRSDEARQTLLDLALGRVCTEDEDAWAARTYLGTIDAKADALALLAAGRIDIVTHALQHLQGAEVDAWMLTALAPALQSKSGVVRMDAASVLACDPGGTLAKEKVEAVIASIESLDGIDKADERFPSYHESILTNAEQTCSHMIEVLARMAGAQAYLAEDRPGASERVRWILVVARGRRGEAVVREQLWQVAEGPQEDIMRYFAVQAMGWAGIEADIPRLERVASADPLMRTRRPSLILQPDDPDVLQEVFPVRLASKEAVRRIRERTAGR